MNFNSNCIEFVAMFLMSIYTNGSGIVTLVSIEGSVYSVGSIVMMVVGRTEGAHLPQYSPNRQRAPQGSMKALENRRLFHTARKLLRRLHLSGLPANSTSPRRLCSSTLALAALHSLSLLYARSRCSAIALTTLLRISLPINHSDRPLHIFTSSQWSVFVCSPQ